MNCWVCDWKLRLRVFVVLSVHWHPFHEFAIFVFRAVVSQVVTGYLPIQILHMFLSLVPPVMIMISSLQGYISWSQIQKSACTKVLWFTIWNIFFANVLSGSALYRLTVLLEPKEFPRVLAEAVPAQVRIMTNFVSITSFYLCTEILPH